ncbi:MULTISPECIES: MBL fold metallo-hydrolase [Bacteria]|uniref:MBL fold metallo-hydrolase n=1 Tax=Tsuneonella aeria TaxID=1837929 RepID=A0A6I4TE83_9SPHN|nr:MULTISPECIES: MBL fold metallo-hydrolase [Bacteria]MXO75899.1 MBL fold metallo-hydrolase [Tsuneonella aeria]TCJ40822.1 MBL fold metallo-hydrolase [Parafrankia sp. BMG5.11]
MIFRQLFEPESSTYTYLFGWQDTGEALLLDPVMETVDRDLQTIKDLGLRLAYTLDTHIHADHITSACRLRALTGCKVAYPAQDDLPCADIGVAEDRPLNLGDLSFRPLFTPGHTETHHCYLLDHGGQPRVFTGDALLIDGCGRTDFQNGDTAALFRSVHEKIFTLPPDTLVYPAHDYQHRHVSTVAQERERNPRLNDAIPFEEFEEIMTNLDLPYPKKIDVAVPANRKCGDCPEDAVEQLHRIGGKSPQGWPS